jgi:hypothetical protein
MIQEQQYIPESLCNDEREREREQGGRKGGEGGEENIP